MVEIAIGYAVINHNQSLECSGLMLGVNKPKTFDNNVFQISHVKNCLYPYCLLDWKGVARENVMVKTKCKDRSALTVIWKQFSGEVLKPIT